MRALIRHAAVYVWHTLVCLAIVACCLSMVWAFCYARNVHQRRKAERLLQELQALAPGAAGSPMARQIAKHFGASEHCANEICSYGFEIAFAVTNSGPWRILRRTEWDYFGLRPWRVDAQIKLNKAEITGIELEALVARGQGWLYNESLLQGNMWGWWLISVEVNADRFEETARLDRDFAKENAVKTGHQIEAGSQGMVIRKPNLDMVGGGEGLQVYLSPAAPTESRRVAFNINLHCTTAMSSCAKLCQVVPSAWQSYSKFQKSNGWWVQEDTECPSQ